ncbi:hypothetical protein Cgig2_011757 [Carnegiea gigantea]|uniref:Uncharacterized protein n=1 Tax=Carnegiea gigantea TaxID=171969 RepID=A0A9Q1GPV4_9CARY|nr:hypothetical protein Cgig2_011757 [Carnegiea gigantea]
MACNKLLFLIKRLDYEQWIAAMETSFGGFLSVRTSTISKDLTTWLLQKFDPASNTLKLSDNRVLEITEEDVHATLALPMGQLELFYLDRVEFRGKRCKDRWFPMAIHWTTDAVEQRNEDEKEFSGEYGRGKTIDRIDYLSIIREGETYLHEEFASLARENQKHTDPAASTHGSLPAPQPPCSECGREREPQLVGLNDPIEV